MTKFNCCKHGRILYSEYSGCPDCMAEIIIDFVEHRKGNALRLACGIAHNTSMKGSAGGAAVKCICGAGCGGCEACSDYTTLLYAAQRLANLRLGDRE